MILNIYDVGHGFCAYVRDMVTGANLLIDCGYNERTKFHPVDELLDRYGPIGGLIIQNYDEDHMDGLPHLIERAGPTPVQVLFGNPTLTSRDILAIKEPPYALGLRALIGLKSRYVVPLSRTTGAHGQVYISQYYNSYPVFDDTNNLSLVTFVHGLNYSVIFPGDLEVPGWRVLLMNPMFRADLARVKVFVASHHGRTDPNGGASNGYCKEVFKHCRPDVVVISDDGVQYDTQEHCYAQHAAGISWNGGREVRRVLTTRNDGHLRMAPAWGCAGYITASAA